MLNEYMKEALEEAYKGIRDGHGGPFGAIIVRDRKIIGRGHNMVIADQDPTMHGEIVAIRDACRNTGSFDLKGSQIYTTGEPCPMCLGAILWAGIDEIFYGCNRIDCENIGFRDNAFYEMMNGSGKIDMREVNRKECLELFKEYKEKTDKVMY